MKLLFVLPSFHAKGIATFYIHLFPGLLRTGQCTIDICLTGGGEVPSSLQQQSSIRVFGVDPRLTGQAAQNLQHFAVLPDLQVQLARAFAAFRTCEGGEYDVVETTDYQFLYVPWVIRSGGPPIVVQLHSSEGQLEYYEPGEGSSLRGTMARLLETSLLGRADELQTYSPSNAAEWSRLLNRDVCHIWPVWFPPAWDKMPANAAQAQRALNAEGKGVVVAHLQPWKGPEALCKAAQILGPRAPKILWVGEDSPHQSMSAFLQSNYGDVWGETILPVGEMPREVTAKIQAAAKFAVVPSKWDTFNLATVEAMWAAKTVICSEGAGACGLITHGENGFRFPAGDANALAELLAHVDELPQDARNQIGRRAHNTILRELDLDRISALRMNRYRELSESKAAVRQEHAWFDSVFGPASPQPPFAFLSKAPTRQLAKWTLLRTWRRIRSRLLHWEAKLAWRDDR